MGRFITTWRDEHDPLKWDFCMSESQHEVEQVAFNLKRRGVTHFTTHKLGEKVAEFSSRSGETNDGE